MTERDDNVVLNSNGDLCLLLHCFLVYFTVGLIRINYVMYNTLGLIYM